MNAEAQKTTSLAFAGLFRDVLVKAISAHCGAVWQASAAPMEGDPAGAVDDFHAIFSLEGSLNGDLHLRLASGAAVVLAGTLLGQKSEAMGDTERDALTEFIDSTLPLFCESAAALHGTFTASLTVTSSPLPKGLESHSFSLTDAQGAELTVHLSLAPDLAGSLAEQLLAQEAEARQTQAEEPELVQPELSSAAANQDGSTQSWPGTENPITPLLPRREPGDPVNLELVLDVELNVTLRFGQRQLTLREVLELTSGSVIELDRQVEEAVELLLDGRVIARGEAVVIDGNYGLRVTEVPQQLNPAMLR